MPAVPMPDAATEKTLSDARSQAAGALKGKFPDSMIEQATGPVTPHPKSVSVSTGSTQGVPAAPEQLPPATPDVDATPVPANVNVPPKPEQGATPVEYDDSALWQSTKQTGKEFGLALGRAALDVADGLGFAAVGATYAANRLTGGSAEDTNGVDDAVFGFLQNHVEKYRQKLTLADSETNPYAHTLGRVTEAIAPLALGVAGGEAGALAGAGVMAQDSATQAGKQAIDDGQTVTKAVAVAALAGTTAMLSMKIPLGNPSLVKRIMTSIGIGVPLNAASEEIAKAILKDSDYRARIEDRKYRDTADNMDPTSPSELVFNTLMQTAFAFLGGPKGRALLAKHDIPPPPDLTAADMPKPDLKPGGGEPPPPPPGPNDVTPAPPGGTPIELPGQPPGSVPAPGATPVPPPLETPPGGTAKLPDQPAPEPSADLKAQVVDMKDPATARKHVYITPENAEQLGPEGIARLAAGAPVSKNFDKKGGVLISKDFNERSKAAALRTKNGPDAMQETLGALTGAGDGKTAADTVVVQGQTPEGAVATEKTLTPEEAPAAVAAAQSEGKTPVVTTPEAAVARRAEEIAKEGEPAKQAAIAENPTAVKAPGEEIAPTPATSVPPESGFKQGDRHIVKVGGKDVPVLVWGGAKDGKVPVKILDEDGRASRETHQVPESMFPKTEPKAGVSQVAVEPQRSVTEGNEKSPPAEKSTPLQEAVASFDKQNTPEQGKKFAGDLGQHAARVAELARAVLRHVAKTGGLPDSLIDEASAAANPVRNIDQKSTEQLAKGQGVSHKLLDEHADELKRVAKNLLDPDKAVLRTEPFAPKARVLKKNREKSATVAEKVKAKQAEKKAAAPEEPVAPAKPAVEGQPDVDLRSGGTESFADIVKEAADGIEAGKAKLNKKDLGSVFDVHPGDWERVYQAVKDEIESRRAARIEVQNPAKAKREAEAKVEKVPSGIKDVADETELPKLNAGHVEKIRNGLKRYMEAGSEEIGRWHDNLDRILHEAYPNHPEHAEMLLDQASSAREEAMQAAKPKTMSATVDEDELRGDRSDDTYDESGHSVGDDYDMVTPRAAYGNTLATSPIGILHEALQRSGFWKALVKTKDKGSFVSTHKLLDHLINVADKTGNDLMRDLISKVRLHVPDLPIRFVDKVVDPYTGVTAANTVQGRWYGGSANHIQVRLGSATALTDSASFVRTHTMIHEIVHAATGYELSHNPNGEFSQEISRLRDEAMTRLARMEADTGVKVDHYGLKNEHEFVAEALTNPEFQKFLIDSEKYDRGFSPSADLVNGQMGAGPSLFDKFATAIAKFFGLRLPRSAMLLRSVLHISQRVMESQSANDSYNLNRGAPEFLKGTARDIVQRLQDRTRENPSDSGTYPAVNERLARMQETAHSLEDPPKLQHDDEFRNVLGEYGTSLARGFRAVVKGKLLGDIRKIVPANVTYDQLIRTALRRGGWGHNEVGNPVRDYDEAIQQRNMTIMKMVRDAEPIVNDRAKLSFLENRKLGNLQRDSTIWGIDPEAKVEDMPKSVTTEKGFDARLKDFQARWKNMSEAQKDIYRRERDWNENAYVKLHKVGTDLALDSYSDAGLTSAQRSLLYSVREADVYDSLIGKGKQIDIGDRNDKLISALQEFAGTHAIDGPYFHLGRFGDHVVTVEKEGVRTFPHETAAQMFAQKVRDLGPSSKAKYEFLGGQHTVNYKADYMSLHESEAQALTEAERMRGEGWEPGVVTMKASAGKRVQLSKALEDLVGEASRRVKRASPDGELDEGSEAVMDALRKAYLSQMASQSSYAGSKLARRGTAGVKGEEMGRSFATHAQSLAWNIGHMQHAVTIGEALGKLRTAAKDPMPVPGDLAKSQRVAADRGRLLEEIQKRTRQETEIAGTSMPLNSTLAKLGFMNYMTSFSHSALYMTQNFSTGIPVAASRFGMRKASSSLMSAMRLVSSPGFRETFRAMGGKNNVDGIMKAIQAAVAKDPRFGKWAVGGADSPLQQLIDRGAIHTSLSNQIATAAKGGSPFVNRVMEYARILPSMTDLFNRVSTGLAALELHNGDVYRAGDFIKEIHIDYSAENKSRFYRALGRVPGGNSITMFRSYIQGMTHLVFSHFHDLAYEDVEGGRTQALKTIAGLMLGASVFAGVQRGMGLEPIRAAMYAYNKLRGDKNEYYDFDNMSRRAVVALLGNNKGAEAVNYGLPHLLGIDISSRMGLSDLFLHDPPDASSLGSIDGWRRFGFSLLGAGAQELADKYVAFSNAMETGRMDDWAKVIPVKLFTNLYDAYQTATEGKINAAGAKITEPSAGASISHLGGFRTAEEAIKQDKMKTDSSYIQFAYQRKQTLINQYLALPTQAERDAFVKKEIVPFNQTNPGKRIAAGDIRLRLKARQNQEFEAAGKPVRDPNINKLNDY